MVVCRVCASASKRAIASAEESFAFCSCALIVRLPYQYGSSGGNPAQFAVAVLVILRVVLQIRTRAHVLDPFLVRPLPIHSSLKAWLEIHQRTPAGFLHQFFTGESVGPVVPRTIR